jgi:hypothetical protein
MCILQGKAISDNPKEGRIDPALNLQKPNSPRLYVLQCIQTPTESIISHLIFLRLHESHARGVLIRFAAASSRSCCSCSLSRCSRCCCFLSLALPVLLVVEAIETSPSSDACPTARPALDDEALEECGEFCALCPPNCVALRAACA